MAIPNFADINVAPDSIDWRIMYTTQVFVSPFNRTSQTAEIPGARWQAKMNFSSLGVDELRRMSSFFIQLRGMAGRFSLYDMSLPTPQSGSIPGGTTVSSATGTTVTVASATGLTEGDYLSITPTPTGQVYLNSGPELKMITDITGNVLTVEPPFRIIPSATDDVIFDAAPCTMMLDSDDQAGWSSSGSIYLSNFTVSCMEAF